MDLSRLPLVVIEEIERFVQPWRTYKKEEADLITWHCMWLEYEDGLVRLDRLGSALHSCGRVSHLGDDHGNQVRMCDSVVCMARLVSVGHKVRLGDGYRYARRMGAQNSS